LLFNDIHYIIRIEEYLLNLVYEIVDRTSWDH